MSGDYNQQRGTDNVPLLAKGQSLSGKRLLYSNYVEGELADDSSASIVEYPTVTSEGQGSTLQTDWPQQSSVDYVPTNQVTGTTIKDSTDPHRVQINLIAAGPVTYGALDGNTTSNTVVPMRDQHKPVFYYRPYRRDGGSLQLAGT